MAKRVEMIAPFEALRGNVSGKQELLYPTQDNTAWEAPSDKRQYARNYKPRYVVSKRSSDGKIFFSLRTKNAVMMSPAMRTQQAILSVSSVCADKIMRNLGTLAALQDYFVATGLAQRGWSFKRWIMYNVGSGLKAKNNFYFNSPGKSTIIFHNPYSSLTIPDMIEITGYPIDLLVKFWPQLANSPLVFAIDGRVGVCHEGDAFGTLVTKSYNVLGLTLSETIGTQKYAMLNGEYVQHKSMIGTEMVYQSENTAIYGVDDYVLTSVAPTA